MEGQTEAHRIAAFNQALLYQQQQAHHQHHQQQYLLAQQQYMIASAALQVFQRVTPFCFTIDVWHLDD